MSRWRPAAAKSSAYITAEGHARLKAEFEHLWRERRPEVVRALAEAAAEGDRSENAEYIYRKKELREIDATDEQVRHKAKAYKAQYPNATLTPTALIKHWSSFAQLEKKQQRPSVWDTYERPEYY